MPWPEMWSCRFTKEKQLSIPGTLGHCFPILQVESWGLQK